jgi:HEAT repeat protein
VPVWSFAEVIDPTFNQPLSVAVKEFSSKLAGALYSYKASDATVKELVAKVNGTQTPDTFLDVYALGFTNNLAATDTLVSLTKSTDEYVRLAAISSLGNLRAASQFELLKTMYQDIALSRQDRDMALKAIADLGTPESDAFIRAEIKQLSAKGDTEAQWTSRILALYL